MIPILQAEGSRTVIVLMPWIGVSVALQTYWFVLIVTHIISKTLL
jgi:hypothetical protein